MGNLLRSHSYFTPHVLTCLVDGRGECWNLVEGRGECWDLVGGRGECWDLVGERGKVLGEE